MSENTSTIKRPIVEGWTKNFIGFDPMAWELALELGKLKWPDRQLPGSSWARVDMIVAGAVFFVTTDSTLLFKECNH